jgi:hypothetical protein
MSEAASRTFVDFTPVSSFGIIFNTIARIRIDANPHIPNTCRYRRRWRSVGASGAARVDELASATHRSRTVRALCRRFDSICFVCSLLVKLFAHETLI